MNLDKMITIQRRGKTQDAAGQVRETWQNVADVWASLRPVSGRDFHAASGQRAEVTHEIVMRYGPDLRPHDRIMFDGREFDVIAPMNLGERNRYIKAMSKERVDHFGV